MGRPCTKCPSTTVQSCCGNRNLRVASILIGFFKLIGSLAGNLMLKHVNPSYQSDVFLLLEAIGAMVTLLAVPVNDLRVAVRDGGQQWRHRVREATSAALHWPATRDSGDNHSSAILDGDSASWTVQKAAQLRDDILGLRLRAGHPHPAGALYAAPRSGPVHSHLRIYCPGHILPTRDQKPLPGDDGGGRDHRGGAKTTSGCQILKNLH